MDGTSVQYWRPSPRSFKKRGPRRSDRWVVSFFFFKRTMQMDGPRLAHHLSCQILFHGAHSHSSPPIKTRRPASSGPILLLALALTRSLALSPFYHPIRYLLVDRDSERAPRMQWMINEEQCWGRSLSLTLSLSFFLSLFLSFSFTLSLSLSPSHSPSLPWY